MSYGPPGEQQPGNADELRGPTVLRMILGSQMRRLREAAGVTPDQAAWELRASRSKISRMEHGRVRFKDRDVADLLTLYGITDEKLRARMLASAQDANAPGWWSKYGDLLPDWFEEYLGLEGAASVIRTFELQFVHGLFQTESYARSVTLLGHKTAPAEEIDRRVSLRIKRQDILASPEPPALTGGTLSVSRVTGSLGISLPLPQVQVDATLAWGRNLQATPLDSFLFEANFDLDGRNAPFVRLEVVQKTAHDLGVPGFSGFQAFTQSYLLSSAVVGFVHSFPALGPIEPALGARASIGRIPQDLDSLYGSRAVFGYYVYLLARAPRH